MRTVWKYQIPWDDWHEIEVSRHAKVLSVGLQEGNLFAWILVDTDADEKDKIGFRVAGTGHELDGFDQTVNDYDFVGTVFYKSLVFHVFAWNVLVWPLPEEEIKAKAAKRKNG